MSAGRTVNSGSKDWCTPPKYIQAIKDVFDGIIELDPCSNKFSIIQAEQEIKLPNDGLAIEWNYKTIFINPPYGADKIRKTTIKNWIAKCAKANKKYSSEIIALIPVATNTSHWKDFIFKSATAICFLSDTRLKFLISGNTDNKGAPMACCFVYWGKNKGFFKSKFECFGTIVFL